MVCVFHSLSHVCVPFHHNLVFKYVRFIFDVCVCVCGLCFVSLVCVVSLIFKCVNRFSFCSVCVGLPSSIMDFILS